MWEDRKSVYEDRITRNPPVLSNVQFRDEHGHRGEENGVEIDSGLKTTLDAKHFFFLDFLSPDSESAAAFAPRTHPIILVG